MTTALVIGGSGALGDSICRRLAADGYSVTVGYHRHRERAEVIATAIHGTCVPVDATDPAQVESVIEPIDDLEVLVHAAGTTAESPLAALEDPAWRSVMAVHLDAAFYLIRTAARTMMARRSGRIILLSSILARRGGRGHGAYAATKAGIEALVRSAAIEIGRRHVTINAVAPGVIDVGMGGRLRREQGGDLLRSIALERFGTAAEVAAAVSFLAGPDAAYITGQVLAVDGGIWL